MNIIYTIFKRAVQGMLCMLIVGMAAGYVYQTLAVSSDLKRMPAPGMLVDVDGRNMHIYCQGVGSPTAIIEQGAGGNYSTWSAVNLEMSGITRVCSYDRAGAGYSEPTDHSLNAEKTAERLNKVIEAAQLGDDLILIGWSAGGIYIREFYRQFPEKVTGMILVDSSHEQQRSRLINPAPPQSVFNIERIASHLAPLGVVRISGEMDRIIDQGLGTEEQKARLKVIRNQSHWMKSYYAQTDQFEQELALNNPTPELDDLPLRVISRGQEVVQGGMPSYYTLKILEENEKAWQEMQRELTGLSSAGVQVIAADSGHSIHQTEPELIVAALQNLVTLARNR